MPLRHISGFQSPLLVFCCPPRWVPVKIEHPPTVGGNKTLVVVTGNLRCGELAWKTLYENVLDVNQADLLVLTQPVQNQIAYPDPSILHRARYVWTVPMYNDWADAVDLMNITEWRKQVMPHTVSISEQNNMLGGIGNVSGSNVILGMYKWFLIQLIEKHGLHERYDQFLITRNDHYYSCPYKITNLRRDHLWVPRGQDWFGISDRLYVVGAQHVLSSLNILYPILANVSHYAWLYNRSFANSEFVLKTRWEENGLRVARTPRVMFTCAQEGDTSRWGQPKELVPEGVRLKYPREYHMAHRVCARQKPQAQRQK